MGRYRRLSARFLSFFFPALFSLIFFASGPEPSAGRFELASVSFESEPFGRAWISVIILACLAKSS